MHFRNIMPFLLMFTSFNLNCSTFFIPDSDSMALVHIGLNTLNSVRELNEILTEQREFGENFERVYATVENGIWKAERTAMWLEDMKELKSVEIENIDDFNYVLSRLKTQTSWIKSKMVTQFNNNQESKAKLRSSKREEKRSQKRLKQYSSEAKGSLSPQMAQIETAKNTKDLVIENARMNTKIDKLSIELTKLTVLMQEKETRRLTKELKNRSDMNHQGKGVLTQREVSRK